MNGPRSVLLALLAVFASGAQGQEADFSASPQNFINYRSRAFLVAPPVLVCGPKVVSAGWSPDGLFMLIQQQTAAASVRDVQDAYHATVKERGETWLKLYTLSTGTTRDLLRMDMERSALSEVQWIPTTDHAFMVVLEASEESKDVPLAKLYNLDAAGGTVDPLRPWVSREDPVRLDLFPSSSQPYIFVRSSFGKDPRPLDPAQGDPNRHELALLNAAGVFVSITPPEGFGDMLPLWSKDGTRAYVFGRPRPGQGKKVQWYRVALTNGALTETERPLDIPMEEGKPVALISVREVRAASTNGSLTRPVQNVWLETLDPDAQNRLLLAGDAREAAISNTLEAASYIAQDSLFVRPIIEVPKDKFEQAVVLEKRRDKIARAKTTGLALIMFSADNEDVLPDGKARLKELLEPYFAPGFHFDDFVYTFPGGRLSDLKNPAGAQLGYIDTGDGLAVVYADGHVQWKPKAAGR